MERNGLFFDPLQGEGSTHLDAPPQGTMPPREGSEARAEAEPSRHATVRRDRPAPEELGAQRRRELDRVQEDLRLMAQGRPPAGVRRRAADRRG
ncbi:hypothetical protein FJV46_08970 [Arthrobacter agilis]|uniref:hypothetical protein n=1 Tax=Arthrobacter agilis TaxID=37921 RepID=UPI000B36246A|nr:hypothetical protein [Arthrobacter agilis]PPB47649.1 hypothetical protein CI784_00990 [Arthrobacter agilis]TPV24822.1 hypothetical protein FJV46_08970 [Arthrobacter agilis]VDR30966.1 Uncharacterised protein [Arthrobacter agilis]